MLAPYVPEDVAKYIPPAHRDPDGFYATVRSSLCVIAYNTDLFKPDEAPKSFADLLDPKWKGKIVKAHPVRELGCPYLEKLSKQNILQVQSATDTPNKIVLGECAVMAGRQRIQRAAAEGGRQADRGSVRQRRLALHRTTFGGLCRCAASNAARLFENYLFGVDGKQLFVNIGAVRSVHALVKDKPGRTPLSAIKVWRDDPAAVEAQGDEIKRRYSQYFHV